MFFPFMMDLSIKKIVIVGGGTVAYRKCKLFLDFGADITIVSPVLRAEFSDIKHKINHIQDSFKKEYLNDAFAVIAASNDNEINRTIACQCTAKHIPVNVVDVPELCSFIVPAVVRRGDLTIGICTAGKSPALAGTLRQELSDQFGEEYAHRLQLLGVLRNLAKCRILDDAHRRELLIRAATLDSSSIAMEIELLSEVKQLSGKEL